jgi:uncharacterized repeat protein (TIGR03803 family)
VVGLGTWVLAAALGVGLPVRAGAISLLKVFPVVTAEGRNPVAALVSDGGGTLFGVASDGGTSGYGAVFAIKTDGSGLAVLHSFTGASDGAYPRAALVLDGAGNLYGTTETCETLVCRGAVFTVKTDGSGFTVLHTFAGGASDGAYPGGSVTLDGAGNLYGTTERGGASDDGTVFTIKSDGTGFALLHSFAGTDGAQPYASLALDPSGRLFGTTAQGGAAGKGTVFAINSDGGGFAELHGFADGPDDGSMPAAALILDGGTLYGTSCYGGTSGAGTVFKISSGGAGFAVLYSFTGGASDGARPLAALVLDGTGSLYGTTVGGGASGLGTVFRVGRDGSGFAVLHTFAGGASDGAKPEASLVLEDDTLYGTTSQGGPSGYGTVFRVKSDGDGFALLHSASPAAPDGMFPYTSVISDGAGNLYGTTYCGGAFGGGVVFTMRTDGSGYAVLHSFAGGPSDGAGPLAALVLDNAGTLYGTTCYGGAAGLGTVFEIGSDGGGFAVLHSFAGGASDGTNPKAALILDAAGTLRGTTYGGGPSDLGTVFGLGRDGTGFVVLHSFAGGASDGALPTAALVSDGAGTLYGTTFRGGGSDDGTVYSMKSDGSGFAVLHSFASDDGANPNAPLARDSAGTLYGTTWQGGAGTAGTVFRLQGDGTGFAVLHDFHFSDGGFLYAPLTPDGAGNLYGTATSGGEWGNGTVFGVRCDGSGFKLLHSFLGFATEGESSYAAVILDGAGTLYGTTKGGGGSAAGTVFSISSRLTVVKSGPGGGTVASAPAGLTCGSECAVIFPDTAVVTLTATPAAGSSFTGWSGEGCSGTGTCQVTMSQARTVTATFDLGPGGMSLYTVTPCRVLDTRNPAGPLGGPAITTAERSFTVVGTCGIPASARSVSVNVTVVGGSVASWVAVFPGDIAWPGVSTINYKAGQARANNAVIPLASDGSGTIKVRAGGGTVHVVLDVNAYFQ